jgi:hypothetical protein
MTFGADIVRSTSQLFVVFRAFPTACSTYRDVRVWANHLDLLN